MFGAQAIFAARLKQMFMHIHMCLCKRGWRRCHGLRSASSQAQQALQECGGSVEEAAMILLCASPVSPDPSHAATGVRDVGDHEDGRNDDNASYNDGTTMVVVVLILAAVAIVVGPLCRLD